MARFEIEIPDEYIGRLERLAELERRTRKNYCETEIIRAVTERTVKLKNKWVLKTTEAK